MENGGRQSTEVRCFRPETVAPLQIRSASEEVQKDGSEEKAK